MPRLETADYKVAFARGVQDIMGVQDELLGVWVQGYTLAALPRQTCIQQETTMRTKLFHVIVPVAFILTFPLGTMAQMASDSGCFTTSVLSGGGTVMDSGSL